MTDQIKKLQFDLRLFQALSVVKLDRMMNKFNSPC